MMKPVRRLIRTDGRLCIIEGCGGVFLARGWCGRHYKAWQINGDPLGGTPRAPDGAGTLTCQGYVLDTMPDGTRRLRHVLIAERALGHPLPPGAEVHHVDENKANNDPGNLVICPNSAYHKLLHSRMRALAACGHCDWLKCEICKQWDSPESVRSYGRHGKRHVHQACAREYQRTHKTSPGTTYQIVGDVVVVPDFDFVE